MDVEASSQKLVHEILTVIICKVLPRIDDTMHVSLHQVSHNVDVFVALLCRRPLHIYQANYILVIKEFYKRKEKVLVYSGNVTY